MFTFEPAGAGEGTSIAFGFRMAARAFPFTILFPLLRPVIARQVRSNIERRRSLLDDDDEGDGAR